MNALTMRMIGLGLFGISWLTLVVSTSVGAVDAFGAPALLREAPGMLVVTVLWAGLGLCLGLSMGLRSVAPLACVAMGVVSAPLAALGVFGPVGVPAAMGAVGGVAVLYLSRATATRGVHGGATPA